MHNKVVWKGPVPFPIALILSIATLKRMSHKILLFVFKYDIYIIAL